MNKCHFSGTIKAIILLRFCSMVLAGQTDISSSCSEPPDPHLLKNCHPEPGVSKARCLARNCCWSPSKIPDTPWCLENIDGCSTVAASDRINCYPERGANETACKKRGCHWCITEIPNVPFCFFNNKEASDCTTKFPVLKRIDCHPQPGASREMCKAKGCLWCSAANANVPRCFYPEDGPYGYSLNARPEKTAQGLRVILNKHDTISLFGNDISPVAMDIEFHTKDRLRFKIYDPNDKRFEVPLGIDSPPNAAVNPDYYIEFLNETSVHFRIIRKNTGTVLWDTSLGGLVFSNQFIQMMTTVPSTSIYGFGEHEHASFKHDMNFIKYAMFSRDQPPRAFSNLYGVHPFYMCIEDDFNAHGVLLLNSNAQDIILKPQPSLTFRTIGGILDFYMFFGPTPENVVQQYTEPLPESNTETAEVPCTEGFVHHIPVGNPEASNTMGELKTSPYCHML